ncbi:MAG: choice-of-anchor J domain-containing protein [Flavobacteriales bacterium]|nr:choice-of-anchor J domain-containing protein [Flavobacteriales bacterium]
MERTICLSLLTLLVVQVEAQVPVLDRYLTDPLVYTDIVTAAAQVSLPRDLDFKPHSNELWVMNRGNATGGSMVIVRNAGLPGQTSEYRKDSHSGHFMVQASAMAFSPNGEWAAVSEVQNTSSPSSTFMGPALWSGDPNIFATVFQNNWVNGLPLGSHLDMLHQSPFAMGIASDSAKVYWVMDGHFGNICRYDFVQDHGPGYDYHGAGKIWRYTDVPVSRVPNIPSHMVLDRENGWLYFIDGGAKQIKRMNVNSGSVTGNLSVPPTSNEPLAGYYQVQGATVEVVDTWATQPSGIDHIPGRLVVSDHTTGAIRLYDVSATPTLLGTITTGMPSIMGLKVGPDGRIWFTHYNGNKVVRIDPQPLANDASIAAIVSPSTIATTPNFFSTDHGICAPSVAPVVDLANRGSNALTSVNIHASLDGGPPTVLAWTGSLAPGAMAQVTLPSMPVVNGPHQLDVWTSQPNGATDPVVMNDRIAGSFRVVDPVQSLPFFEGFTASTFPPAGWNYVHFNPNNRMTRNPTVGGFGNSQGCVKMDNHAGPMNITGQRDHLMMPALDLSNATVGTTLDFAVAYRQYNSSTNDRLMVQASTDCGASWSTLYDKAGAVLSTAPAGTGAFTPNPTQWRAEQVGLASVIGQPEVLLMFLAESNFGNNLYLDDVQVGSVTGIDEPSDGAFTIFPNPNDGRFTLRDRSIFGSVDLWIHGIDGRSVHRQQWVTTGQDGALHLDVGHLAKGSYVVSVMNSLGERYSSIVVIQ